MRRSLELMETWTGARKKNHVYAHLTELTSATCGTAFSNNVDSSISFLLKIFDNFLSVRFCNRSNKSLNSRSMEFLMPLGKF